MRWPIGTDSENKLALSGLPGAWQDINPFMNYYQISGSANYSYHTGADLELHTPLGTSGNDMPVYAVSDGTVLFSGIGGGSWVYIIVVKHTAHDGTIFYARYAHVDHQTFAVPKTGDSVKEGQQIAKLGNGDGYYGTAWHLHFDICLTDLLAKTPNEWPGLDKATLLANYTAPIAFIVQYKQKEQPVAQLYNGLLHPNSSLIPVFKLNSDGSLTPILKYSGGSAIVFDADPANGVTWSGLQFSPTTSGEYVYTGDVIQGMPYVAVVTSPGVDVVMYANVDAGTTLNIRELADMNSLIIGTFASGAIVHVWQGSLKNNFWQLSQQNGFVDADFVTATAPGTPAPSPTPTPVVAPTLLTKYIAATANSGVHVRTKPQVDPSTIVKDVTTGQDILLYPIDPSTSKPTVLSVLATPTAVTNADNSVTKWWQIDPSSAPLGGYWVDGDFLSDTAPNS